MLKATFVSCYNAFERSGGHHVHARQKWLTPKKELIQKGESFSLYRINLQGAYWKCSYIHVFVYWLLSLQRFGTCKRL
jgi:hypothetical protein